MAKRKKRMPSLTVVAGCEGRFELGERTIEDPLEPGARRRAIVNVRESAIAHMASRRRINAAQEQAGERFRQLWEQAAIGRARGIDPAKEFVDGGTLGDPLSDGLVRASRELKRAMEALGHVGSSILVSVVGEGKRIEDVAEKWAKAGGIVSGKRAEGYVTGRLIEAIDELVKLWGMEGIGQPNARKTHYTRNGVKIEVVDDIVGSGPIEVSGPAYEITVGRFGDSVREEKRPIDRGPLTVHTSGNASSFVRRKAR